MTVLVEFGVLVRVALVSLVIGFVAGVMTACSIEAEPAAPPRPAPTAPATVGLPAGPVC